MTLVPAATAATVSRLSRPVCARWVATSEDEQAVSVLMQGPGKKGQTGARVEKGETRTLQTQHDPPSMSYHHAQQPSLTCQAKSVGHAADHEGQRIARGGAS